MQSHSKTRNIVPDKFPHMMIWLFLIFCSCARNEKINTQPEAMANYKTLAAKWYDAFNTKNPLILDSLLDKEWEDIPSDPQKPTGKNEAMKLLVQLTTTFPDFNCNIKDVLQDGNKVVVRSELTGTQKGEFMGRGSKNRRIFIQAVDIHMFKDGKIVKTWHTEDWMTGLHQLGIL